MTVLATTLFGAYVMQPIGNDLLLALGNDPANENGAVLLRSADGTNFAAETVLSEQGVADCQLIGDGRLFVAGIDPYEDWTLGNIYERSAGGAWTKRRTLPNTIHCFGLWHSGSALYAAVGAHTGDNATWRGRVLKSMDDGATWAQSADVNQYRIFDVMWLGGELYATGVDWTGVYEYELYRSADDGQTWQTLAPAVGTRPRLAAWRGKIYAVGYDYQSLIEIGAGGALTTYVLPFTIKTQWNVLTVDGNDRLNVLSSIGLWRSDDLVHWTFVASGAWISAAYWPAAGAVMVSESGLPARVMMI